ncbi:hypothetical protein [Rubrivivax rivuli]|uniref:hypothetical protein n=1 Tax=Rubrivivax rivuli TaxID=1862385 RepID=UPI0013E40C68|nr:hypothetical protein [Rubrivivax rivuli]
MKMTVKTIKPRNPFVAASLRRVAGSHAASPRARRQAEQRLLRAELERLKPSP